MLELAGQTRRSIVCLLEKVCRRGWKSENGDEYVKKLGGKTVFV